MSISKRIEELEKKLKPSPSPVIIVDESDYKNIRNEIAEIIIIDNIPNKNTNGNDV